MDSASSDGLRILVIDRDPQLRAELRERLQRWGFLVLETDAGDGTLAPPTSGPIVHGVLLALHEAAPGGLDLLHRARRTFPDIPIIVMSDVAHIQVARQAVNLGAREYVIKPFDPELLRTKCLKIFAVPPPRSPHAEPKAIDSTP